MGHQWPYCQIQNKTIREGSSSEGFSTPLHSRHIDKTLFEIWCKCECLLFELSQKRLYRLLLDYFKLSISLSLAPRGALYAMVRYYRYRNTLFEMVTHPTPLSHNSHSKTLQHDQCNLQQLTQCT